MIQLNTRNGQETQQNSKRVLDDQDQNETGDEYAGHGFGEFGNYMSRKRQKIQNQAQEMVQRHQKELEDAARESGKGLDPEGQENDESHINNNQYTNTRLIMSKNKTIFRGCVIYINGYTGAEFSSAELQRMIVFHGGIYVQHMVGKTSVTHIVASTLTTKKKVDFANYRVVRPDWIKESVKQDQLADWKLFRTIPEMVPKGQTRIILEEKTDPIVQPAKPNQEHQKPQDTDRKIPDISDPGFIKHYYLNSRLHHLSMWKAAVRQKYLVKASFFSSSSSLPIPCSQDFTKVFLHVDFDCFFAAVAHKLRPNIPASAPICVASGTHDHSDIASCNYEARKLGVKNGMSLARAKVQCPELVVLGYDFEAYEKASLDMYDILMELGANCVYPVSVDEALLDVTGVVMRQVEESESAGMANHSLVMQTQMFDTDRSDRIKQCAISLGNTIRLKIWKKTALEVSVGIGPNIMLARVALANAKPAGVYYIKWETRFDDLIKGKKPLEIKDLPGVGYRIAKTLAGSSFNIATYEDLVSFCCTGNMDENKVVGNLENRKKLEKLLGAKIGTKLWEFGQGIGDTNLQTYIKTALDRKSIGVEISWGVRADNQDQVDTFIQNLCNELSQRLAGGGISSLSRIMVNLSETPNYNSENDTIRYKGAHVTVKVYKAKENADPTRAKQMGHGQCNIMSKSKPVPSHLSPTRDENTLADLAISIYKTMNCSPEDLRGVGIQVTKLTTDGDSKKLQDGKQQMLKFVSNTSAKASTVAQKLDTPQAVTKGNTLLNQPGTVLSTPRSRIIGPSLNRLVSSDTSTSPQIISPLQISTPVSTSMSPVPLRSSQIDWETYYMLPSSVRKTIKEEYNLTSTPRHLTSDSPSNISNNISHVHDLQPPSSNVNSNLNTNRFSKQLLNMRSALHTITQFFPKTALVQAPRREQYSTTTRRSLSPPPTQQQFSESLAQLSVHYDGTTSAPVSPQRNNAGNNNYNNTNYQNRRVTAARDRIANSELLRGGQFTLTQQFLAHTAAAPPPAPTGSIGPAHSQVPVAAAAVLPPIDCFDENQFQNPNTGINILPNRPLDSRFQTRNVDNKTLKLNQQHPRPSYQTRKRGRPPNRKVFSYRVANNVREGLGRNQNNVNNDNNNANINNNNDTLFPHYLNQSNYFDHPSIIDPTVLAELPSTIIFDLQEDVKVRTREKEKWQRGRTMVNERPERKEQNVSVMVLNSYRKREYRDTLFAPVLDSSVDGERGGCEGSERGKSFDLKNFSEVCKIVREWIKETSQEKAQVLENGNGNDKEQGLFGIEHDGDGDGRIGPFEKEAGVQSKGENKLEICCEEMENDDDDDLYFKEGSLPTTQEDVSCDELYDHDASADGDKGEDNGPLETNRNSPASEDRNAPNNILTPYQQEQKRLQILPPITSVSTCPRFRVNNKRSGIKAVSCNSLNRSTGTNLKTSTKTKTSDRTTTAVLVPGPHPADVELFYHYCERLSQDPLRWINAVKLVRWMMSEVVEIVGCECWKKDTQKIEPEPGPEPVKLIQSDDNNKNHAKNDTDTKVNKNTDTGISIGIDDSDDNININININANSNKNVDTNSETVNPSQTSFKTSQREDQKNLPRYDVTSLTAQTTRAMKKYTEDTPQTKNNLVTGLAYSTNTSTDNSRTTNNENNNAASDTNSSTGASNAGTSSSSSRRGSGGRRNSFFSMSPISVKAIRMGAIVPSSLCSPPVTASANNNVYENNNKINGKIINVHNKDKNGTAKVDQQQKQQKVAVFGLKRKCKPSLSNSDPNNDKPNNTSMTSINNLTSIYDKNSDHHKAASLYQTQFNNVLDLQDQGHHQWCQILVQVHKLVKCHIHDTHSLDVVI